VRLRHPLGCAAAVSPACGARPSAGSLAALTGGARQGMAVGERAARAAALLRLVPALRGGRVSLGLLVLILASAVFVLLDLPRPGSRRRLTRRLPRSGPENYGNSSRGRSRMRYLFYDNAVDVTCGDGPDGVYEGGGQQRPCVGINHYVANLRTIMREARASRRVALLRPICLCGRHNGGRTVRAGWERYVNLTFPLVDVRAPADPVVAWVEKLGTTLPSQPRGAMLRLEGAAPIARIVESSAKVVVRVLPDEREFLAAEWGVAEVERARKLPPGLDIRESAGVRDLAARALREMSAYGDSFVCVRARRGDKLRGLGHLRSYPCLDKCTRPANIARVLRANGVQPGEAVYVLTDEAKAGFFEPLSREHGFSNVRAMKDLHSISAEAAFDNFMAFAAEQAMCRHARGIVNTNSDSIAALAPHDPAWKPPAGQFRAMLTPYQGECPSSTNPAHISICKKLTSHPLAPRCDTVCNTSD
jgi:xanthosine utilization system XapX-like protein